MSLSPQTILANFHAEPGFRRASQIVLEALAEAVRPHLAANEAVVGSSMHLRPDDDYVGVAASDDQHLGHAGFSATAWQRVRDLKGPIGVTVATGRVWMLDRPEAVYDVRERGRFRQSQLAFQLRSVTHLFVLPLTPRTGAVEGMISIELQLDPTDAGKLWALCRRELCRLPRMLARDLFTKKPDATPIDNSPLPSWAGERMRPALARLDTLARMGRPLLLSGPRGSGTTSLARHAAKLHRPDGPIVFVPVAAYDVHALCDELNLTRPGSAATRARQGTLVLDGVDALQLQDHRGLFGALDDLLDPVRTDAPRVIATALATREQPLSSRLDRGLHDRLGVLGLHIPGLDQRRDEIPYWSLQFLQEAHHDLFPDGEAVLTPGALDLVKQLPLTDSLPELRAILNGAYARALSECAAAVMPARLLVRHAHVLETLTERNPSTLTGEDLRVELDRFTHLTAGWIAQRWTTSKQCTPLGLQRGPVIAMVFAATEALLGRDDALRALGAESKVGSSNLARDLRTLLDSRGPFLACFDER